jgi:hypothetical protein
MRSANIPIEETSEYSYNLVYFPAEWIWKYPWVITYIHCSFSPNIHQYIYKSFESNRKNLKIFLCLLMQISPRYLLLFSLCASLHPRKYRLVSDLYGFGRPEKLRMDHHHIYKYFHICTYIDKYIRIDSVYRNQNVERHIYAETVPSWVLCNYYRYFWRSYIILYV